MSEMSFEELLNQSIKEIYPGEQVTGRGISVHKAFSAAQPQLYGANG